MERKITHYVVKPEHEAHYFNFFMYRTINKVKREFTPDSIEFQELTEAKVLDLWCTPCYQKEKVTGWYNVYRSDLVGPYESKDNAKDANKFPCCRGQTFIDQEIE